MITTANQVLDHMVVLIKKGWTRGAAARDEKSRQTYPRSPLAVSFCMMGAHDRACLDTDAGYTALTESKLSIYRQLDTTPFTGSISDFNDADGRTVEEVIELILRAKS